MQKRVQLGFSGKVLALVIITVLLITAIVYTIYSASGAGGSESDPLITSSYIDEQVIPNLKGYVDDKFAAAVSTPSNSGEGASPVLFEVIELTKNNRLIGGAGTEFILRMGTANIIATTKGGLSDVTSGVDLPNGTPCPPNHLLIVPLADGRGLEILEDAYVMVKGSYSIR